MSRVNKTDRLLSTRDVATTVGVSARTVARWIRDGDLKALKVGRVWRVRYGDLVLFLEGGSSGVE